MNYLKLYDDHLKRLALGGVRKGGLGPIHFATLPFLAAILCVSGAFEGLGWTNETAFAVRIALSVALLIGLYYSGFRFIHYAHQRKQR